MLLAVAVVIVAFALFRGSATDDGTTPIEGFAEARALVVHPTQASVLYAATEQGIVRGENGTAWARLGPGAPGLRAVAVHPTNVDVLWMGGARSNGDGAGLWRSDDGGRTWREQSLSSATLDAIAVSPADARRMWAHDNGTRGLLASTDGGTTWREAGDDAPRALAIAPHPTRAGVVMAATPQGVQRSDDGGATWRTLSPAPVTDIAYDRTATHVVWGVVTAGPVRSVDGGETWARVVLPDADNRTWTRIAVAPTNGAVVYVASAEGDVRMTRDGGATWRAIMG